MQLRADQIGRLTGDGKSQSDARLPVRFAALERLKQICQTLRRDSRALVFHRNAHTAVARRSLDDHANRAAWVY